MAKDFYSQIESKLQEYKIPNSTIALCKEGYSFPLSPEERIRLGRDLGSLIIK